MLAVLSFHFFTNFYPQPKSVHELVTPAFKIPLIPMQLGWEADMLFFAISGIGLSLAAASHTSGWGAFFIRRVKRIYIPYWVTIVFLLAYQGFCSAVKTWDHVIDVPNNLIDWICNVFIIQKDPIVFFVGHFWFLYTLVILYALFPIIYWVIRRFGLVGFAGLFLSSSLLPIILAPMPRSPFYGAIWSLSWAPSFILGVYVGRRLMSDRAATERFLRRTIPLGIAAFAFGSWTTITQRFGWMAHPMLGFGTLSIAFAVGSMKWHLPSLTAISFEAYLVHDPFIGWYRHFFGFVDSPKPLFYVFFMVTVGLMGAGIHWIADAITEKLSKSGKERSSTMSPNAVRQP
ncbi:hypothetical protein CA603_51565 [Paraburkholderia hospita]|nr:hypothetical protein CA603_51565 [Paraburkholderia hospita]